MRINSINNLLSIVVLNKFLNIKLLNILLVSLLLSSASLAPLLVSNYYLSFGLQICMMLALAQSWNLISGMTGYISFGHAAFFGFGTYTAAILVSTGWHWTFTIIAGAIVAGLLAIPLGLLTLRLRGPYFAIAMLGLNEVAKIFATLWISLTNGGSGISLNPTLLPNLTLAYYCMLLLAIISCIANGLIYHSHFGLELRAIREDEEAAEMIGVHTTLNKFLAFIYSTIIPGAVGAVFTLYTSYINPDSAFAAALNIQIIVIVMLGGSGTVWGPVLGTILLMAFREMLWANFPALHMAVLGVLLLIIVLFIPKGIIAWFMPNHTIRPDVAATNS